VKRNTLQREVIRQVMTLANRPLSIVEIFDEARSEIPALGLATVYRTLKSFREEDVVREVDLPGQSSRWEMAGKSHHHHFLCDKCNKLFEIHGCPSDIKSLVPRGYNMEEHNILLQGQCVDCTTIINKRK
jgi:Fur family transcriptional regulator, ferric uptake regulator